MQTIVNNPYRMLGVLVGASTRERSRQAQRLKHCIGAGEPPPGDWSIPSLGPLQRNIENVATAAANLSMDSERMAAALFWFHTGEEGTSSAAFQSLLVGDNEGAVATWEQVIAGKSLSRETATAFSNLATLYLSGAMTGLASDCALKRGLALKLDFLESPYAEDLKRLATDETYAITRERMEAMFLRAVMADAEREGIDTLEFARAIGTRKFVAREEMMKEIITRVATQVEEKFERAKGDGNKQARKMLLESLSIDVMGLREIAGEDNLKYEALADKVANGILQEGIDQFNPSSSSSERKKALALMENARAVAAGRVVKQRCEKNILEVKLAEPCLELRKLLERAEAGEKTSKNARSLIEKAHPQLQALKTLVDGTDKKELYLDSSTRVASSAQGICVDEVNALQKLMNDAGDKGTFERLKAAIEEAFQVSTMIKGMDLHPKFKESHAGNHETLAGLRKQLDGPPPPPAGLSRKVEQVKALLEKHGRQATVMSATTLLMESKGVLEELAKALGKSDELYLNICTRVAGDALGMCVTEVNKAQEAVGRASDYARRDRIVELKGVVTLACRVITLIGSMDLRPDFKKRVQENSDTLYSLESQLKGAGGGSAGKKKACYIATAAYGDVDHPRVEHLRHFRDEVLERSVAGRAFIRFYYAVSPALARKLAGHERVNAVVRFLLNQFIKITRS